ncbi:MAG: ATP-binding protein [Aquabacterium sp.]
MSHELRTPLNSLLILSDQLCKNSEGNLSPKQIEFAKTIHSSGNDLLMLINDILDLSKIESGTVAVDVSELRLDELQRYVERTFSHVAESKNVDFVISIDRSRCPEPGHRCQAAAADHQEPAVQRLQVHPPGVGHAHRRDGRLAAGRPTTTSSIAPASVLAFSVTDTGIGISPDKQQIIFEAFQQADGCTSRKYGGTGLGLAISRELSRLLGGEIRLVSAPGQGQHVHAVPAADLHGAAQRAARRPNGRPRSELSTPVRDPAAPPRSRPQPGTARLPSERCRSRSCPRAGQDNLANDDRDAISPATACC